MYWSTSLALRPALLTVQLASPSLYFSFILASPTLVLRRVPEKLKGLLDQVVTWRKVRFAFWPSIPKQNNPCFILNDLALRQSWQIASVLTTADQSLHVSSLAQLSWLQSESKCSYNWEPSWSRSQEVTCCYWVLKEQEAPACWVFLLLDVNLQLTSSNWSSWCSGYSEWIWFESSA
jgi:hypothetical protein